MESICTEQNEDCQNGGACVILPDPALNFCSCTDGHVGAKCHGTRDDMSHCTNAGNECENGGTCIAATEDIDGQPRDANYCKCPPNTFGARCHGPDMDHDPSKLDEAAKQAAQEAFSDARADGPICTDNGSQCQNGGFCVTATFDEAIQANYCDCPDGFGGNRCHSAVDGTAASSGAAASKDDNKGGSTGVSAVKDYCTKDGNECQNGSTCFTKEDNPNVPSNYCNCIDGYFGAVCKGKHSNTTPVDTPTNNNPSTCTKDGKECQNGGVCTLGSDQNDGSAANSCTCPEGVSGDRCESTDTCSLKCQHGSSCRHYTDVDHYNSDGKIPVYCDCVGNYKGLECQIPFVTCPKVDGSAETSLQCLYGGECGFSEGEEKYTCICPKGRSGEHCETGEVSTIEDYNGACFRDSDCGNSGLCVRSHDAKATESSGINTKVTQCLCPLGWGGDNCEIRCGSLNCQHGSSCRFDDPDDITHANDYAEAGAYCECKDDNYKGRECEIMVTKCPGTNGMECLYGGQCIGSQEDEDVDFYTCACPPSRMGSRCEKANPNYSKQSPFGEAVSDLNNGPTIASKGQMDPMDPNLIVVGVVVLLFLLFVPAILFLLGKNKRRRLRKQNTSVEEILDDTTETTDGVSKMNGNDAVPPAGEQEQEIFDYDTAGVVDVNLDENEAVPLPKDKEIV